MKSFVKKKKNIFHNINQHCQETTHEKYEIFKKCPNTLQGGFDMIMFPLQHRIAKASCCSLSLFLKKKQNCHLYLYI